MTRLFDYPELRALEDAAFANDVVPTGIFQIALPVHAVTIRAKVTVAEDYDLIDRFLTRGIAECSWHTTTELADNLALDTELADRALRVLTAIGHVCRADDGTWRLTDLGIDSARDGCRYVVTHEDRRILYFDGFGSHPLPTVCYNRKKVTIFESVETIPSGCDALFSQTQFTPAALDALTTNPNRAMFNLPGRITAPEIIGAPLDMYLPLLVILATDNSMRPRCLAYTQASAVAEPTLSDVLTANLTAVTALRETHQAGRRDTEYAEQWLDRENLSKYRPQRLRNGMLRITLPAAKFGGNGIIFEDVGSFKVRGHSFFQLWCTDIPTRKRALVARLGGLYKKRTKIDSDELDNTIAVLLKQLELTAIDRAELQRIATKDGHLRLSSILATRSRNAWTP